MGLFDFLKKKTVEKNEKSIQQTSKNTDINEDENEFAIEISANAKSFREKHKERYQGLDFSVKSLIVLDQLLEDVSDFYEDMDDAQQQNIVSKAGAYIFEVAKQNYGGKFFWYDNLNQPILVAGQPEFEISLLAFEKVKGRLENGYEDNIPFFFQGFIEGFNSKKTAMIV
nr:hypothetical protein [uncultured Flavobacterium sp.]